MGTLNAQIIDLVLKIQSHDFFAQTVRIKLVSPQAALLSMCIFTGKSVVMHLHVGPDKGHTSDRIEKIKSPAPSGIQTHDLLVMRRVLCRCATTAALRLKREVYVF